MWKMLTGTGAPAASALIRVMVGAGFFDQIAQAQQHVDTGHERGSVVITVA